MARAGAENARKTAAEQLVDLLVERVAASTRNPRAGRVTYIVGNNGTGKSRALGALADRLSAARPARTVACIANSIHDRFKYGDTGRVRYLGARNQTNAVFLSGIDRQLSRLLLRAMIIDPRLYSALRDTVSMDLAFNIGKDYRAQVKKLLERSERNTGRRSKATTFKALAAAQPLAILQRIAQGPGKFELLTKVQIRTLFQYLELGVDIQLDVVLRGKERLNFGQLSTGEQNRMLLLAKVLSTMEPGAVFLIDEPEVSLHLHWQMRFHETLMELLTKKLSRFHIVIATHAPVIISEAAKYDPASQKNLVAILRHDVKDGEVLGEISIGHSEVSLETRSFFEVASHDQLVLRYFQSAPYHAREISVEIADTVLGVAEGVKAPTEAEALLRRLMSTEGLSKEAITQIEDALSVVRRGLATLQSEKSAAA